MMPALTLLSLLLPVCLSAQTEHEQAAAELNAVRERIDALKAELAQAGRQRTRAERELREVEKSEQQARRDLEGIRAKSRLAESRQRELEAQAARRQIELEQQRATLATQLRVAYMSGGQQWLRLVLSQQDPAALGRRSVYYGYLSRQRQADIQQIEAIVAELAQTRAEIAAEVRRLQRLAAEAADKLQEIADMRADRAKLVARISSDIASGDAEINKLQAEAEELSELVAKLAKTLPSMPDFDSEPFAGQTSSLDWPAQGPLLKKFGQSRADGSLKWNGVLVGAPAGAEVRAVYHGRVVYSDWLAGMGLLTIVEHGGGYMSLYGHNQDLLKEVGEWVSPGEAIAHVGDSGGQATAGLYFEIRKDGEPVNPERWIR